METLKLILRISVAGVAVIALLSLQAMLDNHSPDPLVVCHVRKCT
ncbi:hypothetical protein AB4Y42_02400 [Paraburkholderia sp. EG286B]